MKLEDKQTRYFIDMTQDDFQISIEADIMDLLSKCYEYESNLILLSENNLSSAFFDLKTGLAGAAMQKFSNYQVKVSVSLQNENNYSPRFQELMHEMNRSNSLRFFLDRESAERWLMLS
ncbi:MAG: DUF4180 domain-containing protein [Candidatus Marinimicrobia bacterium]|nr:DUF4180 domain-containing protein [Candidatus Neomarinimicrobiota bacterium]